MRIKDMEVLVITMRVINMLILVDMKLNTLSTFCKQHFKWLSGSTHIVFTSHRDFINHAYNKGMLAKRQAFIKEEYKQILNLLNKDTQETKQVNMTGMSSVITCLMSNAHT